MSFRSEEIELKYTQKNSVVIDNAFVQKLRRPNSRCMAMIFPFNEPFHK